MATVREFVCMAHGPFESSEENPACPSGCDTVERIFLTPPSIGSARTRNTDATLNRLAEQYHLTDMNNRDGKAVSGPTAKFLRQQEEYGRMMHERFGDGWGRVPPGGTFNTKTQQVEAVQGRAGPGVAGALAEHHAGAEDNLTALKPKELALGVSARPIKAIRDPENLSLAAARPEQHTKAA